MAAERKEEVTARSEDLPKTEAEKEKDEKEKAEKQKAEKENAETEAKLEQELIRRIRDEAAEVRDCFTRYSFQGVALVTFFMGFVFRFTDPNSIEVCLVGVFPIILLQTIASIGTHKYSTANRLLGFELHLQRTNRLVASPKSDWKRTMRILGWEEAMRAWRIVQPTMFQFLYITGNIVEKEDGSKVKQAIYWLGGQFWRRKPDQLRECLRISNSEVLNLIKKQVWFEPRSFLPQTAAYYAGGYLQTMLNVIYVVTAVCFLPVFYATYQVSQNDNGVFATCIVAAVAFFTLFTFNRYRLTFYRRRLLEEGLLSIHSCAIMWQVTVISISARYVP